jgi:ATP-dependent helicase/nuclease subunit A
MTRARDHLYITGFHKGDLPDGCWYETVKTSLASKVEEGVDFRGRQVWRYGAFVQSQSFAQSLKQAPGTESPTWLRIPAPAEPELPVLLPSRLLPESEIHANEKPRSSSRNQARAKGILLHRLLEVLPQLAALERASAATAIASAFSGELSAREREFAIESALEALSNVVFARHHEKRLAEAGFAVTIKDHLGNCRGIITGQVDHITFDEPDITIVDYKSGAFQTDTGLPFRYGAQLAAYRHALTRLYPNNIATIHAALLNTRSLEICRAEASMLDAFLEQFAGKRTE